MARVVVIGGGYGGLASAARLAKIGHDVTLLEAGPRLGGAIGYVEQDGFRWDSGPTSTLLPAVMRDLFRKSGRALEKEIDLVPVEPVAPAPVPRRRHRARPARRQPRRPDRGRRRGPRGRARASAGRRTSTTFADDWEALRRDWLERPYSAEHASKHTRALLSTRLTLHKLLQQDVQGRAAARWSRRTRWRWRATTCATCPPGWACGPTSSRTSARGPCPGGMGSLADALASRLRDARRHRAARPPRPSTSSSPAAGSSASAPTSGTVDADHVVCAIDPRRLPALAPFVERTMPAIPPVDLPHRRRRRRSPTCPPRWCCTATRCWCCAPTGIAPAGAHAWTLLGRGRLAEDIVTALHRAGHPGARPGRGPRRPVAAGAGRGVGRFAVRRAVAGPQHRHPPARPTHADRERLHGRGARHARAPGCRRSASPPPWWRR